MYARRIKGMNAVALVSSVRAPRFVRGPLCQDRVCSRSLSYTCVLGDRQWRRCSLHQLDSGFSRRVSAKSRYACLAPRSDSFGTRIQFRLYSSKGDDRNTSEEAHASGKDGAKFDNQKTLQETIGEKRSDAHARLVDLDQKEWLDNERLAMETNKKASPFLSRREKFMREFKKRIVPWEKIHVSWDNFPYYINEHAKSTLVECATAHLKHKELSASHGAGLASSSGRILLQSVRGSQLYRERVVRALAQDLQVPLLVLDSNVLAPHDFNDDYSSESESDDNAVSGAEMSESEDEDENDAANEEEWSSSNESGDDADGQANNVVELRARAEAALKKLVPFIEDIKMSVSGELYNSPESSKSEATEDSSTTERELKKGDHVKYIGQSSNQESEKRVMLGKISTSDGLKNAYTIMRGRNLSAGQRGVVYEVRGDEVAVIFDVAKVNKEAEGDSEEKSKEHLQWVDVKEIEHDPEAEAEDCYIVIEALSEVLNSVGPLIVYFPDSSLWLSKAVPKSKRKDFVHKLEEMFDQLSGPAVLICGRNTMETGSREKDRFTMVLPSFGRLAKLPLPLKRLTDELKASRRSNDGDLYKLFTNVLSMNPPKEEELLKTFNKQIEEDRKILISRFNLNELQKVLEENELSCMELLNVNTDGVVLTNKKAEKVVGWAKNYHLSNCPLPTVRGGCLVLPQESLEIAIWRLKEQETISQKQAQNLKSLAKDEYETNFVSAVVPPGEIGVKFDDVGALEDVKKALNELVILPMRRPELFTRGNLLRPCKGILLFGPPGTGKTLLAKALATEAGANFISVTGSTMTSKWFGDAEKLTKALFSFASKLAPVIIFVDEVDSLLGARGGTSEHEATRRMRNEFMAAWDGLRSKDDQRILILGATNRPFDLDDAVIRRLPRRIYVDLPDASNRLKILKIMLAQENLEPDFQFEALANATDGYSGSDLKNLCIAAAYRPVQELLEEETKGAKGDRTLRSLKVDDFIQSKSKVGPSVAYDASSMNDLRKWNEQYGEGGSRKRSPFGFATK